MPVKVPASGPRNAKIMVVLEAPGAEEEVGGRPLVGSSGNEFNKLITEVGLPPREEMWLTNACKYRPPMNDIENFFLDSKKAKPNELILEGFKELAQEIADVKPRLIIAMGSLSLMALGVTKTAVGITKWRGSMLSHNGAMLLPTFHPANVLREWANRSVVLHDLRRANAAFENDGWPVEKREYIVRPSFSMAMDVLGTLKRRADDGPLVLASDLETRYRYIACHALAWGRGQAISIPNLCVERPTGYFTLDEDVALWERERELMTHENVEIVGQNYLYDMQYFARRRGYVPRLKHDTMCMQQVAWPGLPKALDYLSSMYCRQHVYWKDEGKTWDKNMPEEQLWKYNCEDADRTLEIKETLERVLRKLNLWDLYQWQMQLWPPVLEMMLRGVLLDTKLRDTYTSQMMERLMQHDTDIHKICGFPLNVKSPKQMHSLFYEVLKFEVIKHKKTKKPTVDDDALEVFKRREPLLKTFIELIQDRRSMGVILSNFLTKPLDEDDRIRCYFNPTGAETFRWSSSESAFDTGTNLQNITKGDEEEQKKDEEKNLPNLRKLFKPDSGYTICSVDLTGADAQAVAWEANDPILKDIFRRGVKLHAENAKLIFGPERAPTGYEQPYYDDTRTGVHLVNYGGNDKTLAAALATDVSTAAAFRKKWFELHPWILDWQTDVENRLSTTRAVSNKFGYRRYYFDRISELLPEALAWIGQSNTACVTNRALLAAWLSDDLRKLGFQLLLQVHDEIVFQIPTYNLDQALRILKPLIHITVPYDDPLVIPWGLKTSTISWGHCEKRSWPS